MDPEQSELDLAGRFVAEVKSYVPVLLPTLLVYTIESGASLKIWHAVRQLPYLESEKGIPASDLESHTNTTHLSSLRSQRDAIKKEFRRIRIQQLVFALLLIAICGFDQYVTLNGWLNRSRAGEAFDGYVGTGTASGAKADAEDELDGQGGDGYGWYYDSTLGQIDWAKLYYSITLFLPAVFLVTRALYLLSGLKERAVLRDIKGMPFTVTVPGSRFVPRRPALVNATIILASVLIAVGALWFRNSFCAAIVFASMVRLMACNIQSAKVQSVKNMVIAGAVMVLFLAFLLFSCASSQTRFTIRLLYLSHLTGDTNWTGLIFSAMVSSCAFQYFALSYRMDHAFARGPEESVVGSQDVLVRLNSSSEDDVVEVKGTRISYCTRCTRSSPHSSMSSSCSPATRCLRRHARLRYPKPYFHTSILSYLLVYALIALLTVLGYIECEAEAAGVYALYVAPPIMSLALVLCAIGRGEVRRVWGYREVWVGRPDEKHDVQDQIAGDAEERERKEEGKVLIEIETEKKEASV